MIILIISIPSAEGAGSCKFHRDRLLRSFLPSKEILKGSFLVWWHQLEVVGWGLGLQAPHLGPSPPSLEVPMTHLLYLLCFLTPSRWHPHPLAHRCTWSEAGIFVCAHVCACVHCMPVHTCACICLKIHPFPEQFRQALILLIRPSASPSLIEFNNCSVD